MWQPITSAPYDRELALAVIERDDVHALIFPCRRAREGWIDAGTGKHVAVSPTHWKAWQDRDDVLHGYQRPGAGTRQDAATGRNTQR